MQIDLNNNLTLRLIRVVHEFHQKSFHMAFELFPTEGTLAGQSPDEYRWFAVDGMKDDIFSGAVYDAAIGKSAADIIQLLRAQYTLYQTDPKTIEEPLRPLIEYVAAVGIKS